MSFTPDREGILEEKLILACDNQTSEYYKVTGQGAVLDLDIVAVDGKEAANVLAIAKQFEVNIAAGIPTVSADGAEIVKTPLKK